VPAGQRPPVNRGGGRDLAVLVGRQPAAHVGGCLPRPAGVDSFLHRVQRGGPGAAGLLDRAGRDLGGAEVGERDRVGAWVRRNAWPRARALCWNSRIAPRWSPRSRSVQAVSWANDASPKKNVRSGSAMPSPAAARSSCARLDPLAPALRRDRRASGTRRASRSRQSGQGAVPRLARWLPGPDACAPSGVSRCRTVLQDVRGRWLCEMSISRRRGAGGPGR
jgi:hypothetical protein